MVSVTVLVTYIIRILLTPGFLAADIAKSVSVLIDMIEAHKLRATSVANPVRVFVYANVGHPASALVTDVITILIDVMLAGLLHTECGTEAFLTSSVIIPVEAVIAHPKTAKIARMIMVIILVQ